MGVGSLRGDQPSGLSDPLRRLAQPLIQTRHPQNEPRTETGVPLFALASSVRSRLKSERCRAGGLRTTPCGFLRFPHANPKPDRPLRHSRVVQTKKPLLLHWVVPSGEGGQCMSNGF